MMTIDVRKIDRDIQTAEKLKSAYAQRLAAVEQWHQALQEQKRGIDNERKALDILNQPMPPTPFVEAVVHSTKRRNRKPNYGKTNTQLFEEIITEHGRPMHMSSILDVALVRGLKFKGKRPPVTQMRSALSSCKRLYNVGGNYWWVIDHPLPENASTRNGHGENMPLALS